MLEVTTTSAQFDRIPCAYISLFKPLLQPNGNGFCKRIAEHLGLVVGTKRSTPDEKEDDCEDHDCDTTSESETDDDDDIIVEEFVTVGTNEIRRVQANKTDPIFKTVFNDDACNAFIKSCGNKFSEKRCKRMFRAVKRACVQHANVSSTN